MTLLLAPGLLMGPAPPADAPPGPGTVGLATSKAGDPSAPSAFAALLQAVTAGQGGGETAPPIGGTPSLSEAPPALMELLARVLAGDHDAIAQDATEPADQRTLTHLLDRFAGAGTDTDGAAASTEVGAAEALMAYLVMAQRTPAAPDTVPALPADALSLIDRRDGVSGTDLGLLGGTLIGDNEADLATLARMAGAVAAGTVDDDTPAGSSIAPAFDDGLGEGSGEGDEAAAMSPLVDDAAADALDRPADATVRPVERPLASADATRPSEVGTPEARTGETPAVGVADRSGAQASAVDAEMATGVPVASMMPAGGNAPRVETVAAARVVDAASLPAEVADTVRMAAIRGDSEVRLVLNPPDLGHLDIRIASGEGGLRIMLEASQSGARELIDRSLVQLQQALEARDLRVDRLEVRAADTGRGMDTSTGQQSGGFGTSDGSGDAPEWSPVAALGLAADGSDGGTADGTDAGDGASNTSTTDGRVDVMA